MHKVINKRENVPEESCFMEILHISDKVLCSGNTDATNYSEKGEVSTFTPRFQ